ncbi:MAG: SDR family NAD(P)-dependent oxidoreductase [Chitinophagaceae bacterium]|nr:SDR family NAD(P)-dependent oxidoreductase [Chitinophagaceae bacterium]
MHNKKYCLITGASEGFGKALALECASRNMNLVLVALPGPELYYLAGFIKNNYKVDVVAIEKDLSLEENCVQLFKEVQQLGLPVNMLINNAGLGSTMLFHEGSIAFYQKQIRLNIMATTLITHLFLDELRANGPSYIMNVGSLCSYFFLAKKQVYGATKSFIYFFSKSLRRELKQDNIHISVVCPGGMNTNVSVTLLAKSAGWLSRQSVMNPEDVAPVAINGLLKHKEVIIPGKLNRLFLILDKVLPAFIKTMITGREMNHLKSITAIETRQQTIPFTEKQKTLTA